MLFSELQTEVSRGAVRNEGGTTFTTAIKNIINRAIFRISRECPWRPLRRKTYISTNATYTVGSGAGTFLSAKDTINITGATFRTDDIHVGRRIKLSGSGTYYTIRQVNSETQLTLDQTYNASASTTTGTYSILGQEEYTLPIQSDLRAFLWHEEYGYPYRMNYVTDQSFYDTGLHVTDESTPEFYRMWGEDMVLQQPKQPSSLNIVSSSSSDTNLEVTIFGTVSGYPDVETITTTNAASTAFTTKTFSNVDRIVKDRSTTGRITVRSDNVNNTHYTTVAVIPAGDYADGVKYSKVQLYPLPDTSFDINVQYYKTPFRLVNDNDIHELGEEFDQAIIYLSTAILKYENDQDEGDKFFAMYQNELKVLRRTNVDKLDWIPMLLRPKDSRGAYNLGRGAWFGPNQVGGYYGFGSYF